MHSAVPGGGGTWAYENAGRTLTIHLLGPATTPPAGMTGTVYKYTATVTDHGRFVALPGQLAPNQFFRGSRIVRPLFGTVSGYTRWGLFYANALPRPSGAAMLGPTAIPAPLLPQGMFAPGTSFSGVAVSSYGYFYGTRFLVHRTTVVTVKTGSKMTLGRLAASRHMSVRALLRLNPKLVKFIGKKVPKGTKVRVIKVITVTVTQHWASTSYNGHGQSPMAGNITGRARR